MIKWIRKSKLSLVKKVFMIMLSLGIYNTIAGLVCITFIFGQRVNYENNYKMYGSSLADLGMAAYEYQGASTDARNVLLYLYNGKTEEMMNSLTSLTAALERADGYFVEYGKAIKDDTSDLNEEFDEAYTLFSKYKTMIDGAVDEAKAGNVQATTALFLSTDAAKLQSDTDNAIQHLLSCTAEEGNTHNDEAYHDSYKRGNIIVALYVLMGLLIAFSGRLVRESAIKPVKAVIGAADKIANGDIDVNIARNSNDEFGTLADSFNAMVDNIRSQAEIADRIAAGDLTVVATSKGEHDILGNALKKLVEDNNAVLSGIKEATDQVSVGSEQVASASQSLAQGSTEQASAIEQITASIVDITTKTRKNADDANSANCMVLDAKDSATTGNDRMKEMRVAMAEINESSENISKIIKVIDNIAFQTNILALNASVEAARAGVHGKGFTVVAEEVRNLASKSAQAANETAELIENSMAKVANGSKLAEETAQSLSDIVTKIEEIVTLIENIAVSSNDQATAIMQIDQAISQVSQVVQTNSATSEQCAAAAEQLSAQSMRLKDMISVFRLDSNAAAPATIEVKEEPQVKRETDIPRLTTSNETIISLGEGNGKY